MISIADLLTTLPFSQMTVLNKHADLSRRVDSADISETPDISFYIKPHSLLITTGMVFKDNPAGLCRMIEELNRLPIAGICIKLGRFLTELHPSVIATANALHFPLLQIPPAWTLGIACHQLLSYLWNVENEQLLSALKIQRDFSQLLLKDAPLNHILSHLARTIRQTAFVANPFGEIIATSQPRSKITPPMKQALAAIADSGKLLKPTDQALPCSLYVNGPRPFTVWLFPIWGASVHPCLLAVLEQEKIPYPFSYLVIEQTAAAAAFSLYKNQKLRQLQRSMGEEFLQRLTAGTGDTAVLLEQGAPWGLKTSDYYRFLILGIDNFADASQPVQTDRYALVYEWLEQHADLWGDNTLFFSCSGSEKILVILQQPLPQPEASLATANQQLSAFLSLTLSCAAGNPVNSLKNLSFSRIEAEEVYHQSRREGRAAIFRTYYSQGVSELLRFVPPEHGRHFCLHALRALAYPTQETALLLRQTLQAYLDCHGDIAETSRRLFVHRNTVKYRIARINELLDVPIDNPASALQLRLALLLSETGEEDTAGSS